MSRRLWPLALGIVALLATSGCSWIFVQPLPPEHGYDYQPCTSSRVAPVFDTIFTITNLASALYVGTRDNVTNKGASVTLGLAVGTLWALSAEYGYSHTAECEEAHDLEDHGYRAPPHLRAPPRYYPQPPPRAVDPAAAPALAPPAAPALAPPAAPALAPLAAPAVAPPDPGAAPQQGDDDDPTDHRSPPPSPPPAPKKPPERLDAPRFGG